MVTKAKELIANWNIQTSDQRELIKLELKTEAEYEKLREEFNNHKIRNEVKAEFLKASETSGASITKFSVMGMVVAILAIVYPWNEHNVISASSLWIWKVNQSMPSALRFRFKRQKS